MKIAYLGIRPEPIYRRDAFADGLKACGYDVRMGDPKVLGPDTLYLSWNRYSNSHDICTRVEMAGGIALICENGYLGTGGLSPHSMDVREPYALALGHHNDASVIREGPKTRWDALGVTIQSWHASGKHILVCPNRPFGEPGRAMPADWASDVKARLSKYTKRDIRIRPHPGNAAPQKPLADDLAGAWACVIWSSSAGVHALLAGVPVFQDAPYWICESASNPNLRMIEDPLANDYLRQHAMQRLAWAQWWLAEIASGECFAYLLRRTN